MRNDRFEWDDQKAALTFTRRGLSFAYAATVFDDVAGIEFADRRRDYGEARKKLVGQAWDGDLLAVVFTERDDRVRIISARRANKKERDLYVKA